VGQTQTRQPVGGNQYPKSFSPQNGLKFLKGFGILIHQ
jgi:hypothetical protein